LYKNIVDYIQM